MKTLILAVVLMLATSDVIAKVETRLDGKEVLHNCKLLLDAYDNNKDLVGEEEAAAKLCQTLVGGVAGTMMTYMFSGVVHPELRFCMPFDQKPLLLERIVVWFLEENPIQLSQPGPQLVMGALLRTFPCDSMDAEVRKAVWKARNAREEGNYSEAFRLLKPFAEKGDATAQYELGNLFSTKSLYIPDSAGESGGEKFVLDDNEAMKWLRMAAVQGHVPAQYDLGMLLVTGEDVSHDFVRAFAWFSVAASQGHVLAQGLPERAAQNMNFAEIAEAQALTIEWSDKYTVK